MTPALVAIGAAAPSIAMLAVFALVIGGIVMLRRGGDRQKPLLMIGLALVIFANVLIWAI